MELEQNEFEKSIKKNFLNIQNLLQKNSETRDSLSIVEPCKYPLPCLNDFLYGIMPAELIVIGADTGVGKSWLANEFARINAMNKKKVYLFALEGGASEVIEKMRYRLIAEKYYENPYGIPMNFTGYLLGKIPIKKEWEDYADTELLKMEGYLEIYNQEDGLDLERLTQQMAFIKDADLVIIDHLHYFFFRDDKPESVQISAVMRRIKELTEINNVPVVLISHLRKKEKNRGVPDNEDLMGSSNIAKIASKVILLSPEYSSSNKSELYSTIIRVSKDRWEMKPNWGFVCLFDIKRHLYEKEYSIVRIKYTGEHENVESYNYPRWIKDILRGDCLNEIKTLELPNETFSMAHLERKDRLWMDKED